MSDTEHQELWIMVASPFHSITACYASTPRNMLCSSSKCKSQFFWFNCVLPFCNCNSFKNMWFQYNLLMFGWHCIALVGDEGFISNLHECHYKIILFGLQQIFWQNQLQNNHNSQTVYKSNSQLWVLWVLLVKIQELIMFFTSIHFKVNELY